MGKGSHIRISQCMIVKNEEQNIERALSWGKGVMYEQIVVDTGSTDRTPEIARKAGAKVYSWQWTDDFAAAKNYALKKAKGDWIAFLDADEYMLPPDLEKILIVLEQLPAGRFDGIMIGCQNLDDEGKIMSTGTLLRFFRNCPEIRYRGRIHEYLSCSTGRELRIGDVAGEISLFHTGYQNQVMKGKKASHRNRRLIQKELDENPDRYEMLGYMGDECFSDEDWQEAEKWYRRAIQHMPPQIDEFDQRSAVIFARLLMILTGKEKIVWKDVMEVYDQATERMPKEADFAYVTGRCFAKLERAEEAAVYLETAIQKVNAYGCTNRALFLAGNLPEAYELLIRCCYHTGQYEKCVNYAVVYLKSDRYQMVVLSLLLKSLLLTPEGTQERGDSQKENQAVLEFLTRLYDFSVLKDRLFLVKAAEKSDCRKFADYMEEHLFTAEERGFLKRGGESVE